MRLSIDFVKLRRLSTIRVYDSIGSSPALLLQLRQQDKDEVATAQTVVTSSGRGLLIEYITDDVENDDISSSDGFIASYVATGELLYCTLCIAVQRL